jgi:integrase
VDFATDPCTSKWKTDLARTLCSANRRQRELPERAAGPDCLNQRGALHNPALKLKPNKPEIPEIVPLTPDEFTKILTVAKQNENKKLAAMVLVLRFTGIRIQDCVMMKRDDIHGGKLSFRTRKAKKDVFCPLPQSVMTALDAIPKENEYYFWNGKTKTKSAIGIYQRLLRNIFIKAGVPRAHAHPFRHTLAAELLTAGNSVGDVAAVLGNSAAIVEIALQQVD